MSGPEVIEVGFFLKDPKSPESLDACRRLAESLRNTSCLIIRDPRVSEETNAQFIDMMEKYYEQPLDEKMKDVHPEISYQLGATPEFVEVPVDHVDRIKQLDAKNAAHVPVGADPKWRYFWRIGERPQNTSFPELNAPPVIPSHFPQWKQVMDNWGNLMMQAVRTVAEMLAIGLGLEQHTFLNMLDHGPHLLAPTGSDFNKFNKLDTILAGFHYDLNFLTIHGKSRFPGLYIWLRDGSRVLVKVPDGCLLLQAGMQLEWVTGGHITAGFHEVVITPETLEAIERAKNAHKSLWRVSSTLFSHVASDKTLEPIPQIAAPGAQEKYKPLLAGKQVEIELSKIKLAAPSKV